VDAKFGDAEDKAMRLHPGRLLLLAALTTSLGPFAATDDASSSGTGMGTTLGGATYISLPGQLFYSNADFNKAVSISMLQATSNSASNGPGVISQLGLGSVAITNLTGSEQVLTISVSDVNFIPDSSKRPLGVYNSGSGTFGMLSDGSITFQTYASSGNQYFQTTTTDPGVVSTAPVVIAPGASGTTTTAYFSPTNSMFSITEVVTIDLKPHASIVSFGGASLVHAPEPGTLAVALSGGPALALGLWIRRRRARG
jgi:hypothetical protein